MHGRDSSSPEPRTIAGYRLLRQVGEGGMSTVFLSYDVAAAAPVAVKVLADHLATSREFVNRFYREARLSRLLSHPNLVRGLAAGYDPDARKHYLVLEFVDGPTAHAALTANGTFPVGVAVQAGIDIARALDFLHARNYIHRDVKPDNVLLHPDGVAKLADLGLAKRLNDDPHLTSVNRGLGTSYYMAYEQALNADLVDGRSDIYALGATLYHLLTGVVPFPGATHEDIMRGKRQNVVVPVDRLNDGVPVPVAEIIAKSLALDPGRRFQTAGELADALAATRLATPIPRLDSAATFPDGSRADVPTRADLNPAGPQTRVGNSSLPPTATYAPLASTPVARPRPAARWGAARRACVALALVAGGAIAAVAGGAIVSATRPAGSEPVPAHRAPAREIPQPGAGSNSLLPVPPR